MNLQNCDAFNLPVSNFNDCDPIVNFSEIERIFIGGPTAGAFSNIANATEWNTRLSQSTVATDSIRALTVIADMPAAAAVVKELSNGRKKTIGKDFTLNYTVDDISDENYDFFRILDQHPIIRLFAFETQGGKMYNYGNAGILVNNNSNGILARGRDEIETEAGVITWRRKQRPARMDSPIFEGDTSDTTPTTFDTALTFASSTSDNDEGVAGTAAATNANLKFEFNAITPQVGTPGSMTIKVGATTKLVIDYTMDYNGSAFKFTNTDSVVYTGTFTNGTVVF